MTIQLQAVNLMLNVKYAKFKSGGQSNIAHVSWFWSN